MSLFCLITVTSLKAQGNFTFTQLAPNSCKPGTFAFTTSSSTPTSDNHWSYGDGTGLTVWGSNQTTHTYLHPGTYTVTLLSPNAGNFGIYDTTTKLISFSSNDYVYSLFGYSSGVFADSCDRIDTGTFYNKSVGSGILSYHWKFSDGTVSTAPGLTYVLLPQVYENLELNRHVAEFQVSSFSGGGGGATGNGSALPLQLLSFTAAEKQRQVTLSWTKAQEWNIDRYELLVSSDAQHYTILNTSKAGNTSLKTITPIHTRKTS